MVDARYGAPPTALPAAVDAAEGADLRTAARPMRFRLRWMRSGTPSMPSLPARTDWRSRAG